MSRRASAKAPDLSDPKLYINRELSQLEFNFRVLAQAQNPETPLLERLRYLCISSTNLDEFFEIRVAALRQKSKFDNAILGPDQLPPSEALSRIRSRAGILVDEQYRLWNKVLRPALKKEGIRILTRKEWSARQKRWLKEYFQNEVLPVLSPLGLDPSHPFPRILNKSLNLVVVLKGTDAFGREGNMALVRAPRSLPRIIRLPDELADGSYEFAFLSGVLHEFVADLFPGMQVKGSYQFRVTRDSELIVDEEEIENLANAIKEELHMRGYAKAVRLEVADTCPRGIVDFLSKQFEISDEKVYRCKGPVNLSRVIAVYEMVDRPDLRFPTFKQRTQAILNQGIPLLEVIAKEDVLLHHPFDSFAPVMDLLKQASVDPNVLAIKQTLYRSGSDSPMVTFLTDAARNGKDVTVVIELRARFDEEANIGLADRLQEAGVQVVYGVVGHKTHSKMLLIVRREAIGLRRYAHMSTGNYHSGTARLYTDIGLLTSNPKICEDVHNLFQQLSGLGPVINLNHILQSPFTLHKGLLMRIGREIELAKAGKPARIIAKVNAINEEGLIRKLYEASNAGVRIDLLVRGTCTLRPGIKGVSENIQVHSVVGRFLEHSRVYWFANDGKPEIFCSSADWLERNLLRRVETCFPILDSQLAKRVFDEALNNYLLDNLQSWMLNADGSYTQIEPEQEMPHCAQQTLIAKLCSA